MSLCNTVQQIINNQSISSVEGGPSLPLNVGYFNDIPFFIQNSNFSVGRKGVLHTFPFKETPYFEDMNRKAIEINVSAVLFGSNHLDVMNQLKTAAETNSKGELNIAELGILTVYIKKLNISHSFSENGVSNFALEFIEAGEFVYPEEVIDNLNSLIGNDAEIDNLVNQDFIDIAVNNALNIAPTTNSATTIIAKDIFVEELRNTLRNSNFDETIEYYETLTDPELKLNILKFLPQKASVDPENFEVLSQRIEVIRDELDIVENDAINIVPLDILSETLSDVETELNKIQKNYKTLNPDERVQLINNTTPSIILASQNNMTYENFINNNPEIIHPLFTINRVVFS